MKHTLYPRRPRLTYKVRRGLVLVGQLAEADLEAMHPDDFGGAGRDESAEWAAIRYIATLASWFPKPRKEA